MFTVGVINLPMKGRNPENPNFEVRVKTNAFYNKNFTISSDLPNLLCATAD